MNDTVKTQMNMIAERAVTKALEAAIGAAPGYHVVVLVHRPDTEELAGGTNASDLKAITMTGLWLDARMNAMGVNVNEPTGD